MPRSDFARKIALKALHLLLLGALLPLVAAAEPAEIRIAQQYGINYLPLLMMKKLDLVEKHARALGLGEVKVTWAQFGSGAAMNDALLSGGLDFASGGVGPLLTIWDKTHGSIEVRGVASLGSMPLYLVTLDPKIHTLSDFGANDRIALPAVKVSIQAIILEMASAKAFGDAQYAKLDPLTVSMRHPDAMVALLSHRTELTAHFGNSPFQERELEAPGAHKVLSSYDVLGQSTLNSLYTSTRFHDANPKAYRAVLDALVEAMQVINTDKEAAARVYVSEERSKLAPAFVAHILENPDFVVTAVPQGIMTYARFMYRAHAIGHLPASWKDVYFPDIRNLPGS